MYYRIAPYIYALHGIRRDPLLPADVSFLSGRLITTSLPSPLVFEVNHPDGENPGHLLGSVVPVVSRRFADALMSVGVDNFQTFPALLRNPETGFEWGDYLAFNVVGLLDAVAAERSTYDVIMPGGDAVPPLLEYRRLVFARSKTMDMPFFRLLQDPTRIFLSDRIRHALAAMAPPGGWQISVFEVPVV